MQMVRSGESIVGRVDWPSGGGNILEEGGEGRMGSKGEGSCTWEMAQERG